MFYAYYFRREKAHVSLLSVSALFFIGVHNFYTKASPYDNNCSW